MSKSILRNPWEELRRFTPARIALGRAGAGVPTAEVLRFGLAHAQARDAVHAPFDRAGVSSQLAEAGFAAIDVRSRAPDRAHYLRRPDLGRRLDPASSTRLAEAAADYDIAFVIADGLSAIAATRHAVHVLRAVAPGLAGVALAPVVVAEQARVALGDEIGELLGARQVAMLIGERPGLSSPDSLGIYLTYGPRLGRTDAERNCISNVRPEGLPYALAARKLAYLIDGARRLGCSGVGLKDESDAVALAAKEDFAARLGVPPPPAR